MCESMMYMYVCLNSVCTQDQLSRYQLLASSPGHSHFFNDPRRKRGEPGTRRHARDVRDRIDGRTDLMSVGTLRRRAMSCSRTRGDAAKSLGQVSSAECSQKRFDRVKRSTT